jgi:hypothetical protein
MTEIETDLITAQAKQSRGQIASIISRSVALNIVGGALWAVLAVFGYALILLCSAFSCPTKLLDIIVCAASLFVGHGMVVFGQRTTGTVAYLKIKVFVLTSFCLWLLILTLWYAFTRGDDGLDYISTDVLPVYWFFACFLCGQIYAAHQIGRFIPSAERMGAAQEIDAQITGIADSNRSSSED